MIAVTLSQTRRRRKHRFNKETNPHFIVNDALQCVKLIGALTTKRGVYSERGDIYDLESKFEVKLKRNNKVDRL